MSTNPWDPLRDMEDLLERYSRGRGNTVPSAAAGPRSEHLATADWRPVVDISETASEYLIEVELPGIRREDVRVAVDDGVLSVQGQREPAADAGARRFHRRERATGHFVRSFALPESADSERIGARFEDGMLLLSVPKLAERRKRGVEIRIG